MKKIFSLAITLGLSVEASAWAQENAAPHNLLPTQNLLDAAEEVVKIRQADTRNSEHTPRRQSSRPAGLDNPATATIITAIQPVELENLTDDRALLEAAIPTADGDLAVSRGETDANTVEISQFGNRLENNSEQDFLATSPALLDALDSYPLIENATEQGGVILRALDFKGSKHRSFELFIGEAVRFGTLKITLESCLSNPEGRLRDAAALMTIYDEGTNFTATPIFNGWMSAASPGLSTLEHKDYDIWVARCITDS